MLWWQCWSRPRPTQGTLAGTCGGRRCTKPLATASRKWPPCSAVLTRRWTRWTVTGAPRCIWPWMLMRWGWWRCCGRRRRAASCGTPEGPYRSTAHRGPAQTLAAPARPRTASSCARRPGPARASPRTWAMCWSPWRAPATSAPAPGRSTTSSRGGRGTRSRRSCSPTSRPWPGKRATPRPLHAFAGASPQFLCPRIPWSACQRLSRSTSRLIPASRLSAP
mmetsp:Transcript_21009/g.53460  ORF Transcript_21009/g.53460 Transcript_21009/m.53460 type:complete len:221 (-) Transcript_21009:1005-1667(-)